MRVKVLKFQLQMQNQGKLEKEEMLLLQLMQLEIGEKVETAPCQTHNSGI